MVKMKLIVMIMIVAAGVGAGGVWLIIAPEKPDAMTRGDFFGTPKKYDTTGGEDMRPRW